MARVVYDGKQLKLSREGRKQLVLFLRTLSGPVVEPTGYLERPPADR